MINQHPRTVRPFLVDCDSCNERLMTVYDVSISCPTGERTLILCRPCLAEQITWAVARHCNVLISEYVGDHHESDGQSLDEPSL